MKSTIPFFCSKTTTKSGGAKRQMPAASATLLAVRTSQPNSVRSAEGVRVELSEPSNRMLGFRTMLRIQHSKTQFVSIMLNQGPKKDLGGVKCQKSACALVPLRFKLHL